VRTWLPEQISIALKEQLERYAFYRLGRAADSELVVETIRPDTCAFKVGVTTRFVRARLNENPPRRNYSKTAALGIQFKTCIERITKVCTVNNSYSNATARNL
jgi:hypothetical protein